MYLVLSWKKTLYWISLDISKLFCKTLLFTRKKKDKLEEAIFKSPQIQTRSKVFFFRLEKKPERRKKNTLVSFHRHHNHPPSPRSETSISKITRRTRPREKKRRERSSFKGEERSYFIPIGRNPPPTFLFNSRGIDRPPSPPLPYFPPLPRPPRIPKWKKSLRVPATTRFKRQLYKNNIDPGIRRGWRVRDPGFQPSIYIYIHTLVRFLSAREKRWYPTIIERVASTVSVNGRGRPSRVIFLVSKEYNTESRSFPPPHYGDRFKLASFMGIWLHRCCTCACGYFSLFLYLFEGNRWRVEFLWLIRELNVARGDA